VLYVVAIVATTIIYALLDANQQLQEQCESYLNLFESAHDTSKTKSPTRHKHEHDGVKKREHFLPCISDLC